MNRVKRSEAANRPACSEVAAWIHLDQPLDAVTPKAGSRRGQQRANGDAMAGYTVPRQYSQPVLEWWVVLLHPGMVN